MANTLILNQNQVFCGLGTLTFTIPTTGAYNCQVQSTFPSAWAQNSSPLTTAGVGVGQLSGTEFGAGSGMGLGAGTGGGGEGFTGGDLGTGHGGVGQGFGAGNSYQQPPQASSNALAASPVTSQVSIVVTNVTQSSTLLTSTTPAVVQSAVQFKTSFLANANDVITVVLSSSASSDKQLSGVTSNVSIGQGL